jgi:hypothetical protein
VVAAGDADITIVCGFLGCDLQPFNPLTAALPRLLLETRSTRRPGGASENLFDFFMAPSSQELEPPQNPGWFSLPSTDNRCR